MRKVSQHTASEGSEAEVKEPGGVAGDIKSIRSLVPLALGMLVFIAALASLLRLVP